MQRTKQQNIRLHVLLHKLGIGLEEKEELVSQYTRGRATSSVDLHEPECAELITALEQQISETDKQANKQRRRVISHLIEAGYSTPDGKADMPKIYEWVKRQKHKKPFNDLNSAQLSDLIHAAENLKNHYLKKVDHARSA